MRNVVLFINGLLFFVVTAVSYALTYEDYIYVMTALKTAYENANIDAFLYSIQYNHASDCKIETAREMFFILEFDKLTGYPVSEKLLDKVNNDIQQLYTNYICDKNGYINRQRMNLCGDYVSAYIHAKIKQNFDKLHGAKDLAKFIIIQYDKAINQCKNILKTK